MSNASGGLRTTNLGQLIGVQGGTIHHYTNGLPMTEDGRLVVQLNQPPSPGDAYVGGIRVGPLGGIYVTDATPPAPRGFDAGFSSGFGV